MEYIRSFAILIVSIVILFYLMWYHNSILFTYISEAPLTPIIPRQYWINTLPELKILEKNWRTILAEYYDIYGEVSPIKGDQFFTTIVKDEKWKRYYIKWYKDINPIVRKKLPKTCAIWRVSIP